MPTPPGAQWRAGGTSRARNEWQAVGTSRLTRTTSSGQFLLDRLGAERYLDPPLMAVLLVLRRLSDHRNTRPGDGGRKLMMVDMAILDFHQRCGGSTAEIGNFAQWLQRREFFRKGQPQREGAREKEK